MEFTKEMQTAISQACDALGSQRRLSGRSGVPQQNISRYVSGSVGSIDAKNWSKLYPIVCDFLPPGHVPAPIYQTDRLTSKLAEENRVLRERVAYLEGRIDAIMEFGGMRKETVQG